jgi:DNA-binding Lrp family transcriptional regulator
MRTTNTALKEELGSMVDGLDHDHSINVFKSKKKVKPNEPFVMVFHRGFVDAMKCDVSSVDIRVLFTVMEFVSYGNLVNLTHQTIADRTELTRPQVSRSMKRLEEAGFLMTHEKSLFLNPNYICKGDLRKIKEGPVYDVLRENITAQLSRYITDPDELEEAVNKSMAF